MKVGIPQSAAGVLCGSTLQPISGHVIRQYVTDKQHQQGRINILLKQPTAHVNMTCSHVLEAGMWVLRYGSIGSATLNLPGWLT